MIITSISDLHGELPPETFIPKCDVLTLSGDISPTYSIDDINWFNYVFDVWCARLIASGTTKHIIVVAGNHDMVLQDYRSAIHCNNWTYLEDSETIIDGCKFYGSPWSPIFHIWSFMKTETELDSIFSKIPDDTHVLITHTAAHGILDFVPKTRSLIENVGSTALRSHVDRVMPMLHVFGHLHMMGGRYTMLGARGDRISANVSYVDEDYISDYSRICKFELNTSTRHITCLDGVSFGEFNSSIPYRN
jgi:Icc-related predicted phosphoesterase